jgi:pimeloyl-ACP methyl ester carboxylesterase
MEIGEAVAAAAERRGIRLLAPDRPGIGLSSFHRYTVATYPRDVAAFADELALGSFSIVAVSGGGRYGYACAWRLPDRVDRLVTVASTCSPDLPAAKDTWTRTDRQVYTAVSYAPWLFRLLLGSVRRGLQRGDTSRLMAMFPEPGDADREVLARDDVRDALITSLSESLRQGTRGVAHDYKLEARAWGIPLSDIDVPVEIWHGENDRIVSPAQGRLLAAAMPKATSRFVAGEGHISLVVNRINDILASAVWG